MNSLSLLNCLFAAPGRVVNQQEPLDSLRLWWSLVLNLQPLAILGRGKYSTRDMPHLLNIRGTEREKVCSGTVNARERRIIRDQTANGECLPVSLVCNFCTMSTAAEWLNTNLMVDWMIVKIYSSEGRIANSRCFSIYKKLVWQVIKLSICA